MMVADELGMRNPEHEDYEPETESEEDDEQVVKLAEPSKNVVYNWDGLFDKLRDIGLPDGLDWSHRLNIDKEEEQEVVDVNDDCARDLSFYMQALEGVRRAFLNFQSKGEPFLRPCDYYGEMVKPDTHMEKVKGRLLTEMRKIQEDAERRKARENKKLAKEVQAQKMKERAKLKKQEIESVKKWMKKRQQSGFDKEGAGGLDLAIDEDGTKPFQRSNKNRPGVSPGDRSGGKATFGGKGKGPDKKRKSREFRDSKFGFGGRKGLKKQNSAETTNDFRGFHK
ncbi:probable rRNA-processing protein EBP2 homolog [Nicotiana sylvestris]|uniref:Probable rRNA-processing protein EBP2 homolog n=1 Tax=Nicotiana sylvestris TaxID=4096 RepID=A0A1U7WPT9_NICSY|nr:PREDICTED: probable rRNA-processing protein EBP2 homolog [Nicotiana sylvestris]